MKEIPVYSMVHMLTKYTITATFSMSTSCSINYSDGCIHHFSNLSFVQSSVLITAFLSVVYWWSFRFVVKYSLMPISLLFITQHIWPTYPYTRIHSNQSVSFNLTIVCFRMGQLKCVYLNTSIFIFHPRTRHSFLAVSSFSTGQRVRSSRTAPVYAFLLRSVFVEAMVCLGALQI